jgi:Homeodomain-like domain
MAKRVQVRELDQAEGQRLLRSLRRGTGSVVTWRRAQVLLLSAQRMPVPKIAEVTFTSPDRVRDVIHNFNTDGFERGGGGAAPRRRRRATYKRPYGVRHLLAVDDLNRDRQYGHVKPRKRRGEFLTFLRYVRSLYPPGVRIGIVLDNASAHLTTKKDSRVGDWAAAINVELAIPRPTPAT